MLSIKSLRARRNRNRRKSTRRQLLRFESLEDRNLLACTHEPAVNFNVVNDWGSGFQGEVTAQNAGTESISDWTLTFDFQHEITSIWNGEILSHTGDEYVVTHVGWNGDIAPGGTATFGFTATPGGQIVSPVDHVLCYTGGGGGDDGGGGDGGGNPSLVELSIHSTAVQEDANGNAVFSLFLSEPSNETVTVDFTTANGTAIAGSDFTETTGTVSFAPGETQQTVSVPILGDAVAEDTEEFSVDLTNASGATIVADTARAAILDDDGNSPDFNYAEALQKALFFYDTQRSGDLPDDFRVDWRGDSALDDGADVGLDLTGGFWDAGDHVKFVLPMSSTLTVLTWGLLEYPEAYQESGQLGNIEDIIRWGTDWLVKAHPEPNVFYAQVGDGNLDHAFWGAPEVMTMDRPAFRLDVNNPGSDVTAESAATLAAASIYFRQSEPAYADMLLDHAKDLYAFADTYRGIYSETIPAAQFYPSSGYSDELIWGAAWLYQATGDSAYLDQAEAIYAEHFAGQSFIWTHAWDDKRYGSAVTLAQLTGKQEYRDDVERWLDYWTVGINGGATRINYTDGGLAHLNGWGSLRYTSTTALLALIYSDTVNDHDNRYHDFAVGQIGYILGDNPRGSSYLVGFGNNSPQFPHHRAASGVWDGDVGNPTPNRHILYGALVGGPESADDFDYHDDRTNFISNEVAMDYNAGFTGAVARLFWEYGGEPLEDPFPEVRDDEFFVEAAISQETDSFTEIDGVLNNRSAWPARASSELSFRYFVNLAETYAAGFSAADIDIKSYYSQGATIGSLQPWNAAQHVYYVDVSFDGVEIVPGPGTFSKAAQLRVGLKDGVPAAAWDPTNDWSYQGLSGGDNEKSLFIAVYEAGELLFGELPSDSGDPLITVTGASVTEGDVGTESLEFTVRLSASSEETITVDYTTADETAAAGADYTTTSSTLTFAPGTTEQTVSVPVIGDTEIESTETFRLVLSDPVGAVIGVGSAQGTINDNDIDDDGGGDDSAGAVEFVVRDDWGVGFVGDIRITNTGDTNIDGWTLEFDFAGNIVDIWNAEIVSHVGDDFVIGNVAWNGTITPGQTIEFGFQGTGNVSEAPPADFILNGEPIDDGGGDDDPPADPNLSISDESVNEGDSGTTNATFDVTLSAAASEDVTVDYEVVGDTADAADLALVSGSLTIAAGQTSGQIVVAVSGDETVEPDETFRVILSNLVGATIGDGEGLGTILNDDLAPPVVPTISVSDAVVTERDLTTEISPGFLSTDGNQIVDANGTPVKITSVAWFGFESTTNAPHGLWTRNYREMMNEMIDAGFNAVRLPINNEMFDPGKVPNGIDANANPELIGLSPLEILDAIVEYAGEINLRIVLDHHRSDNGIGALNDGLWYTSAYPEQRFIDDWVMLAERYQGNPAVIGADLHNEPHGPATWGTGDLATDWRLAAERTGNAVLAANPDWLIFVEGIEFYEGDNYWWGGNLKGVREHPVRLDVPNRLVYSPHAYPNSIHAQPWFSDPAFPDNLPEIWRDRWGFIYEENIAPIWIGEFGSRLEDPKDIAWMEKFADYLAGDLDGNGTNDIPAGDQAISWSFWSWNPNSGDTGGILLDDWRTLDQEKLDLLGPAQFPLLTSEGGGGETVPESSFAEFMVTLSEPTSVPVSVNYVTSGLSATSGVDFTQTGGTLQFQPGETAMTVRVEVVGDLDVESDETFVLNLSGALNGVVGDGLGLGTIVDNDQASPEPLVSISDVVAEEGSAADAVFADFQVTLDEPSANLVTLSYRTANGSAVSGQDFEETIGDLAFAPGETQKTIRVPILGDDAEELDEDFYVELLNLVGARPGGVLGLATIADDDAVSAAPVQIDFVITNDWSSGFNGELVITNTSNTTISGWQLDFMANFGIVNLWNGVVTDNGNGSYAVANASWLRDIAPGASIRIGFTASGIGGSSALVDDLTFNGIPIS